MSSANHTLDREVGTVPMYPAVSPCALGGPVLSGPVPLITPVTTSGVPMFDGLTEHGLPHTNLVTRESDPCPPFSSPPLFGRTCPPGTDQTTYGKACCTPYDIAGAANLGQVGAVGYPGLYPAPRAEVQWGPRPFVVPSPMEAKYTKAVPGETIPVAAFAGGQKYEALKERANKNIRKARKNIEKLKTMCTDLLKLNDDLIKQNMKLKKHLAGGKCGCQAE